MVAELPWMSSTVISAPAEIKVKSLARDSSEVGPSAKRSISVCNPSSGLSDPGTPANRDVSHVLLCASPGVPEELAVGVAGAVMPGSRLVAQYTRSSKSIGLLSAKVLVAADEDPDSKPVGIAFSGISCTVSVGAQPLTKIQMQAAHAGQVDCL